MSDKFEPGAEDGARPTGRLIRGLNLLVAVVLFGMAALTFVDVIGRDFFNAPIPGTFESVGLLLGIVAFAAFPMVTLRERHITVDLFDHFIRGKFRRVRDVIVMLGIAAMAGFMAERLWAAAIDEWENDFVTEYFGISRAPLLGLLAILCAGTAVAVLIKFARRPRDDAALPTPQDDAIVYRQDYLTDAPPAHTPSSAPPEGDEC